MAERIQRSRSHRDEQDVVEQTRHESASVDYAAILDQIDAVLTEDAEEYVRSFVQKGGQ